MSPRLNAKQQVQAMLDRGWRWRDEYSDVLVHPGDHSLAATYDRTSDTLTFSPELLKALALVIPTPAGRSLRYRRDEKKTKTARR